MHETELIASRYCGPPNSGNGGYVAGMLASRLSANVVTASLRLPPPLEVPVQVAHSVDSAPNVTMHDGLDLIASSQPSDLDLTPVPFVEWDEASAASARFEGWADHPFDRCFVCGTARDDGMRIFPGRLHADDTLRQTAGTWTVVPDLDAASVTSASVPLTWAALDCAGGWAAGLDEHLMVLAQMSAQLFARPEVGHRYISVGELRHREGRKRFSATSLYDPQGALIATAEQLWIEITHQALR